MTGEGWDREDWQAFFEERAGIMEYDGKLPRADAEARAWAEVASAKAALRAHRAVRG